MKSRQREPAVRLIGVRVPNEKIRYIHGLFFSLLAESALAGFERFGFEEHEAPADPFGGKRRS